MLQPRRASLGPGDRQAPNLNFASGHPVPAEYLNRRDAGASVGVRRVLHGEDQGFPEVVRVAPRALLAEPKRDGRSLVGASSSKMRVSRLALSRRSQARRARDAYLGFARVAARAPSGLHGVLVVLCRTEHHVERSERRAVQSAGEPPRVCDLHDLPIPHKAPPRRRGVRACRRQQQRNGRSARPPTHGGRCRR